MVGNYRGPSLSFMNIHMHDAYVHTILSISYLTCPRIAWYNEMVYHKFDEL
jgi:hypothetical protein